MRAIVNTPTATEPTAQMDVEEVRPASGEALVAVRGFSLNRGELALLRARPQGWRPGQDLAGVVLEQAADGSGPAAGTRIVGMVEDAGWSQFAAVSSGRIAELPGEVSIEQAAALPMAGLTALRTLRVGGSLLGRRVLLTGANGGVGRFHVQLARLSGAEVVAVTTRAGSVAGELRTLGADDVVSDVGEASGLFDLVVESVGGAALSGAIKKVAPGGTVAVIGSSSGEPSPISVYDFIGHENARLQNYISYANTDPDDRDLEFLVGLVASGRLRVPLGHAADWSELNSAIALLTDRKVSGKVVLTIAD